MSSRSLRIRYVSPALSHDGYGEFSRYVIWALHHAGHEISVRLLHAQAEKAERFGRKGVLAKELVEKRFSGNGEPEINIVNSTPYSFHAHRIGGKGVVNIGFTMYEAERIDAASVLACNQMDAVFVPSEINRKTFERCGVRVPLFVVQPGIEEGEAAEKEWRYGLGSIAEIRPWTFYSVFEWGTPHKDPVSLLRAYFSEFRRHEPVLLRVKTFERGRVGDIEKSVAKLKRAMSLLDYPRVQLVMGSLTNEEMWEECGKAHTYISTHHGEGWGMPIWEAMASGLPAIATGYGAPLEFMNERNSYLVRHKYRPIEAWANVDVDDLRTKMRLVYECRDEARLTGAHARAQVLRKFTPKRTVSQIESALDALIERAA